MHDIGRRQSTLQKSLACCKSEKDSHCFKAHLTRKLSRDTEGCIELFAKSEQRLLYISARYGAWERCLRTVFRNSVSKKSDLKQRPEHEAFIGLRVMDTF